jgi:hypothetical protein
MERMFISLIAACFVCGWAAAASAEDRAGSASSAVSITDMTSEQFKALAPDATIDVNGERITKRTFLARRQSAAAEVLRKMQEGKARAETEFEASRRAFLDKEQAKLEEKNKRGREEANRLAAAYSASQGPNWEARKEQAFELLDQAVKAEGEERAQLARRAADLLAPVDPQQTPAGPKR